MSHEFYHDIGLYLSSPPTGEVMPISASDALFYSSDWDSSSGYYDAYGTYYTPYGTLFDPERMAQNPWIGAALFRRSIRRLWQRAGGVYNETEQEVFPPQLTKPKGVNQTHWEFMAWNLDERLQRPFAQVLEAGQMAKIKHGHGVAEIMWGPNEDTPFGKRVVIDDLLDRDPRRFAINPRNYPPGIYRRSDMQRLPDKKFIVWTAKEKYEQKSGQSEFLLLIDPEYALPKIEKYERRHLERYGSPLLNLEVPKMSGSAAKDNWRQAQAEQLRKQGNQAVIVTIKDSETLNVIQGNGETTGFENAILREIKKIGTVLLNNPTALIDGQNGSYSKEESTGARSLQMNEQTDAEDLENGINYQLIPWALDFNWTDIDVYPEIQILPPETITPTTPRDQETIYEIKGEDPENTKDAKDTTVEDELEDDTPEEMSLLFPTGAKFDKDGFTITSKTAKNFQEEASSPVWIRNTDEAQKFIASVLDRYYKIDHNHFKTPSPDKLYKWNNTVNELQEVEDIPKPVVPVPVPAGYKDFPNTDPLPEDYRSALDYAHTALAQIQVKEYNDVQPSEAADTFTVKRLRNYTTDVIPILTSLKAAVDVTLDNDSEADAWTQYYEFAVAIFKANGINMDVAIRDDLNISFRQTRQNALSRGLILMTQDNPSVVGLRIVNQPSANHHETHPFWNGVAIPKDHPELQAGGRLRLPMDFGCICRYELVRNAAELTPESEWPAVWPGSTYTYYAQPTDRQPEASA